MPKRATLAAHPSFPFPDELPGYPDITVRFEALHHAECGHLFAASHNGGFGREKDKEHVAALRRALGQHALAAGGDTVAISGDGKVVHGIHLVRAIALSGAPAVCLVVRNVPESSFGYSGICRLRNPASALDGFLAPIRPSAGEDAAEFAARLNRGGAGVPLAMPKLLDVALAAHLVATCAYKPSRGDLADIEGMAEDLKAGPGRWPLTGESLKVGSHGGILDGRKRCLAVLKAREPMPVILVEGIDPAYAVTHDFFRTLNVGDKFHARRAWGQSYDICSTLKRLHWFLGGEFGSEPSVGRMMQMFSEHKAITNSVQVTRPAKAILPQRIAVLLHYGLSSMWPVEAASFFLAFRREALADPVPAGLVGQLVRALAKIDASGLSKPEADRRRMWLVYQACEAHACGGVPSFRPRSGLPPIRFPLS